MFLVTTWGKKPSLLSTRRNCGDKLSPSACVQAYDNVSSSAYANWLDSSFGEVHMSCVNQEWVSEIDI